MGIVEHGIALAAGVVLPALTAWQQVAFRRWRDEIEFDTRARLELYWSNVLALSAFTGLVLLLSSRSLAELGVTAPPAPLAPGLVLGAACAVAWLADLWWHVRSPAALARTRARWWRNTPFLPTDAREVRHALALVVSAAIGEEIVFRGFLVGYLREVLGDSTPATAAAVALPALAFAAAHVYQGAQAVLKIAVLSGILGVIFVVTGSLWIGIALHFAIDLAGVLLAPWLLRDGAAARA